MGHIQASKAVMDMTFGDEMEFPADTAVDVRKQKLMEMGTDCYGSARAFAEVMQYASNKNPFLTKAMSIWESKDDFLKYLERQRRDPDLIINTIRQMLPKGPLTANILFLQELGIIPEDWEGGEFHFMNGVVNSNAADIELRRAVTNLLTDTQSSSVVYQVGKMLKIFK